MQKCVLAVAVGTVLLVGRAQAAVAEGENLLINGTFEAEQVEFPEFWTPSNTKQVHFLRTGGPEGKKAAVVLVGEAGGGTLLSVRQQGLRLVPVGKQRAAPDPACAAAQPDSAPAAGTDLGFLRRVARSGRSV